MGIISNSFEDINIYRNKRLHSLYIFYISIFVAIDIIFCLIGRYKNKIHKKNKSILYNNRILS